MARSLHSSVGHLHNALSEVVNRLLSSKLGECPYLASDAKGVQCYSSTTLKNLFCPATMQSLQKQLFRVHR